ncbi:hypothetical protein [Hymenobacter edaphi]|uniref:Uncharacterized protein n=1 Tax=Hymenobacter edaphi TaxID=2211146 RepID=A0A328BZ03_9BACT|nr:hypothetical protein [Hymenobacter edaphi]RAK70368.1 hypothetical protein DLM85_05880 [Hymenobacter edaphi]
MKVLLALLFAGLLYYSFFRLPRYVSRGALIGGSLLMLLVMVLGVAVAVRWLNASLSPGLGQALSLLQTALVLTLMNQVSHYMVDYQLRWHEENNAGNRHRFPLSVLIDYQRGIKTTFTVFWLVGAAMLAFGILTGPQPG